MKKSKNLRQTAPAVLRPAAAVLTLLWMVCLLSGTVLAADVAAPPRLNSEWIRTEEVAVYPDVEQWSSLFGRTILVPGPYAGAGLSVTLEGVDSGFDFDGFTVQASKKKQTPAPISGERASASSDRAFVTPVLEPNTTYYVYVAAYNGIYTNGYPVGMVWGEWSEPVSVTTLPSTKVNPVKVEGKQVKVSASKVKKKKQTIPASKAFSVKKAKGKLTCQVKASLTEKAENYVKVAKNGTVTVKKGTKKGTYRLSVSIRCAGDKTYAQATRTAALTVVVK